MPLRADAPDVLLSLKPDGAETLFVADPSFTRLLLARAPALSAARQRWRACGPGSPWSPRSSLHRRRPRLLDCIRPSRSPRHAAGDARSIGRNVVASIGEEPQGCETPASRAALDRLTQRLTAAASDKPLDVRVVMLDWSLVNAFAVPGGQIILTRGLVQRAGSSDEVAGVLAHELGHAIELHPEAGLVRALGLSAAAQLVFAGSTGTATNIGLLLTQLRYTRVAEREADAHALRILKGAGISAKGFGDFFERIEGKKPGEEIRQERLRSDGDPARIRSPPSASPSCGPSRPTRPRLRCPTTTGARCATPAARRQRGPRLPRRRGHPSPAPTTSPPTPIRP